MCDECWDADKKEKMLLNDEICDGDLKPAMTLSQLKLNLLEEWQETGKTEYRIFKKILFDAPNADYSWLAIQPANGVLPEKRERISISFL